MQMDKPKRRRPIIWRMTITSMLIVFFVVVLLTVGFIIALLYEVSNAKEHKLNSALASLETKFAEQTAYPDELFNSAKPKNGLNYALYTEDKVIIYTSVSGLPEPELEPMNAQISFLGEGLSGDAPEEYEFIIQSGKWIKNGTLYLYVFGDVTDEMEVIEKVPLLFVGTLAAGLFISFLAGRFMSGMMLRPVKQISSQVKAISASNLNERLPETASNDELQDLAHSFNLMIGRLEKAFDKQRQFVSDASHELRTPLAVMQGHTAMLRRWGKKDRQTLDKSLNIMHGEIRGMVELIDKLLMLARSENTSTSLKKEKIEIGSFLQEIIDEARLIKPDARIELRCGTNTVYADRPALKQVIRILLDNSIKFCPPPGKITLEATSENCSTRITVADKGIGIEDEKLPYVFDRFFCADSSRTKKTAGTGLGLAIAKNIIDSQQGTIHIKSQPGIGTEVSIWLID